METERLAIYLGGGLGDMVHHYTQGDQIRLAVSIKRRMPDIPIDGYVYAGNPQCVDFLTESSFIDNVTVLDKPCDMSKWEPPVGMRIDKWVKEKNLNRQVLGKGEVPLPVPKRYIEPSTSLKRNFSQSVLIHPFNWIPSKSFLDSGWWIDLVDKLLSEGLKVVVIGSPVDAGCPMMEDFYTEMNKNRQIFNYMYDRPFLEKVQLAKYVKAAVVVDSVWMHVMQLYQKPSVLIQNADFYNKVLRELETSSYDKDWHPNVRSKLREQNKKTIPAERDNFHVIWGIRLTTNPSSAVVLKHLRNKIKVMEG